MSWNDSQGSGNRDPWGNRDNAGPPDLDALLRKLRQRFGGGGGGGTDGGGGKVVGGLVWGLLLLGFLLWLGTGFYRVNEGERGVVLRFGAYQTTTLAGLHWHIPFPVERVYTVNVGRIRTIEVGYRGSGRSAGRTAVPRESLMLTEDENIVDIELAVQYRIKDARDYLFNVRDPEITLRQVVESALREVVGKRPMEFIITEGRDVVAAQVIEMVQAMLDSYGTGISVTSVNMQDAQPPEQVQAAFSDAVKAREDKQRLINEAEAYRNSVQPQARGEAARQLADAAAYKAQVIDRASGQATRFSKVLAAYQDAPDVTRERLYLETMEQVLGDSRKVLVSADNGNNVFYLPLDKLMERGGDHATGGKGPAAAGQRPQDQAPTLRHSTRGRGRQ